MPPITANRAFLLSPVLPDGNEDFDQLFRPDGQLVLFYQPIEQIQPCWIRCRDERSAGEEHPHADESIWCALQTAFVCVRLPQLLNLTFSGLLCLLSAVVNFFRLQSLLGCAFWCAGRLSISLPGVREPA